MGVFLDNILQKVNSDNMVFAEVSELLREATKEEYIDFMGKNHDGKEFLTNKSVQENSGAFASYEIILENLGKKYLPEIKEELKKDLVAKLDKLNNLQTNLRKDKHANVANALVQLLKPIVQSGPHDLNLHTAIMIKAAISVLEENSPKQNEIFLQELDAVIAERSKEERVRGAYADPTGTTPIIQTDSPEPKKKRGLKDRLNGVVNSLKKKPKIEATELKPKEDTRVEPAPASEKENKPNGFMMSQQALEAAKGKLKQAEPTSKKPPPLPPPRPKRPE